MKDKLRTANRIVIAMAALGAAIFIFGGRIRAADGDFPIYFESSKLIVKSETINRVTYLPLVEIVRSLNLPYTDATGLETFTIRSGNSRLVVTKNSALISINDQIVLLGSAIRREGDRWMVPIDFLTQGLSRVANTEFRYRPGTPRIFADNVEVPQLAMNAQTLGPITRLTIRASAPIQLNLQRNEPRRAILAIDRSPVDPVREQVDHRDRLVRSVRFDDSDGSAKILMELSDEVSEVRMTPADDNRVFFVDFAREGEITAAPLPTDTGSGRAPTRQSLRVIVIDPGHGGMDAGTKGTNISEKELTLTLARKLRAALQSRLGSTVLLTRDADIELDNETRSAVANNNQADFFISLHVGYSANKLASDSSIFVMKQDFGGSTDASSAAANQLFLPWYLGYRPSRARSLRAARFLREELIKAVPEWTFPVRTAPLGVLTSATMPSLMLEVGNLNNAVNGQTLTDMAFQDRLIAATVTAVERFSESESDESN